MAANNAAPETHLPANSGDGVLNGGPSKSTPFPGSARSVFDAGRARAYQAHQVSYGEIWGDWSWQPGRIFWPPPIAQDLDQKNRNADPAARSCLCGATITRSNAKFCSGKCKQAAYRQREASK